LKDYNIYDNIIMQIKIFKEGKHRDGDGRYNESRAMGYSRNDEKDQLMQKLDEMQRKLDIMS